MKILILSKTYYPNSYGGIEKFIEQIVNIKDRDYSITVCSIHNDNTIKKKFFDNITLLYYPKTFEIASNSVSLKLFIDFPKIAKDHDLIIYNYPWPFQDILNTRTNQKYIIIYHSDIIRQKFLKYFYYFFLRNRFIKNAEYIIFTTKTYFKITDCPKNIIKKIKIINLGIKKYPNQKDKVKFKDYILFIGVLRKYKSVESLIKISEITKKRIVVVGKSKDTSNDIFNNSKYITYLGQVNESTKFNLIQNCKLIILPSNLKSEAFGIVLLEAISFKKPIIANLNITGTKEVCINNFNGYMLDFRNIKKLKSKILELYNNKEIYKKFSINSYKLYTKKFTHTIMINKYKKIFKEFNKKKIYD